MEVKARRKWSYLFVSILLLAGCFFWLEHIPWRNGNILGIFGYLMIAWMTVLPFAFIVLALRVSRKVSRDSFIYVFSGLYTLILGSAGIIFAWGNRNKFGVWDYIFFASLILGLLMFADSFVCELFDFIKSKQRLK